MMRIPSRCLAGSVTIIVSEGDDVPKSIITMTATDPDGDSDGELVFDFTAPVSPLQLIVLVHVIIFWGNHAHS